MADLFREEAEKRARMIWGERGRVRKHGTLALCQVGEEIEGQFIMRGEGPTYEQAFQDYEQRKHRAG